jgi:OmpA-OmpF porin, OOP family
MKLRICIFSLFIFALGTPAKAHTQTPPDNDLNTGYDERNPVVTPDGKTLFLTIANHPQNLGGKRDPGDIWICSLGPDNQWSLPVHGGNLINDKAYNGVAGFSSDGSEMFLLTHYDPNGAPARTQGISVSKRNADGWARPQNISIPYFQNKSNIISGYISPDKSYFVFSAETYGSYGVEDLFICQRKPDGRWSEPKNLGSKINTQFQEVAPSLSQDGRTIYFSTNGRKGKGGFDIFSATRLDDTWTKWSDPVNMSLINSEGRELYFRDFPQLGISTYTNTKNSDAYGEIQISKSQNPPLLDTAIVKVDIPVASKDSVVQNNIAIAEKKYDPAVAHDINVYGNVFNSKTGEPIAARVTFINVKDRAEINVPVNREGFALKVKSLNEYAVRIESKGFISTIEKLDVQSFEMDALEMNFKLQPADVGTTVNLKDVLFEQSKTNLLTESFESLDLVVTFLKENPSVKIELSGHTDNRGIPFQNIKLSQGRVDKVKDYLISKGIEKNRISGKGYGGEKPIASNESEETRKLNRRVEFTIKKN